jgi:regulator of sirC expression with transglutaminase-like and TPR domain
MTPADKLAVVEARGRLTLEVLRRGEAINLARAALWIAAEEEPRRCDVAGSLALLDRMGTEARARVESRRGAEVEALNSYLFEEKGFSGNEADYYDPRNSLLHQVLERRTGIPITLSIVYMEVGQRAGLQVRGVGLPGHFIVRAGVRRNDMQLVDPFHRRSVDRDECQQRLDMIYGGQVPLADEHLRAVGPRDILVRVLGNLKGIYVQNQLYRRALGVAERIMLLAPQSIEARRDRGMLLAQLGRLNEAVSDLQTYLNAARHAPDEESVREQLKKLQIRQATLN